MDVPRLKNIIISKGGDKAREKGGQATFSGRKNEKKGGGRLFQEEIGLSLGHALP